MCVAIIIRHYSARFPLIVFHSREEDVDRDTSPLGVHGSVLSAIDLKANGVAAVGLNTESGRFAVLTNCRFAPGLNLAGASRGSLLTSILTHHPEIPNAPYQGFFHLYYGTVFRDDLTYVSNVDNTLISNHVPASTDLDIIVCSNEHPKTCRFFHPKTLAIQNTLMAALEANRQLSSVEEVANLIQETLSTIVLPTPPESDEYSWSLLSEENEKFVLSHFFIPPISVSDCHKFGTVSQTLIVSDSEDHEVHYWYKSQPNWVWEKRVVKMS